MVSTAPALLVRIAKIAAALFALAMAYGLWGSFLHYAIEPKVIGGVHLDRAVPQVMQWSPVYVPMITSALFAYWAWPKRVASGPIKAVLSGCVAACSIVYFSLFISFLCPGLGALYLLFPDLVRSEVLPMLGKTFLTSAQSTLYFGLFFAVPLVTIGLVVGSAIGFTSYAAQSLLQQMNPSRAGLRVDVVFTPGRILNVMLVVFAIGVPLAIAFAGFRFQGIFVATFWAEHFVHVAIPCLLLGAAIEWITGSSIWCVAVSLPIGYFLSTTHACPPGLLTSQSMDLPPVLFATLIGFGLAGALRSKWGTKATSGMPPLQAG
jgi:hypothetical protein